MALPDPLPKSLPSLSPATISARAGDHVTDPTVATLVDALDRMDQVYQGIVVARSRHLKNPMRTRMANLEAIHDYAWKVTKPTLKGADRAMSQARHELERLETEMVKPLREAANKPLSSEVRQHIRSLPGSQRSEFVMAAIQAEDQFTVGAILGAPPYLSGIKEERQEMLVEQWRAKCHPKELAKARVLRDGVERVAAGGALMVEAVSGLVDVAELKAAKDLAKAAEHSSKLPD